MTKNDDAFDAIVIGSGIGGLATAAILAKLNRKRVLVLEKHFQLGGFTHEFQRGNFSWDVGLHYVGEMAPGELPRQVFDYITDGALKWQKMPYVFERFIYPDFSFDVPSDPKDYQRRLEDLFPEERDPIRAYFRDIQRVQSWNIAHLLGKALPSFIAIAVRYFQRKTANSALITLGAYLDRNFKSPRLKALLASQWGDYGVPPRDAAFAVHAQIVDTYLHGGYFPEGGASRIAKAIRPVIERHGGAMLAGHSVRSLIVENETVIGVTATYENGPETKEVSFYAPVVISDIGAAETYERLLREHLPSDLGPTAKALNGLSAVTAYLGLKDTPEKLGIHGENFWMFDSYDHDRMAGDSNALLAGHPTFCYVSFPSLKTPHPRGHTAEIIAFVNYEAFSAFNNKPWLNRDAAYYDLKEKIADGLIELVDRKIPGLKDLVVYTELSSPLSIENFTSRFRGSMYGIPATPERYRLPWLKPATPLKNFFLTGSDVGILGIIGAMMGGVVSAAVLNGPIGFLKIIAAVKRQPKTANALHPAIAPPVSPLLSNQISGSLVSRVALSDHFYELFFETSKPLRYVPGQHVYLEAAPGEWRPYSIVASQGNRFTLVIESSPGGAGSRFAKEAPLGTVARLRLPTGTLKVHDSKEKSLVFVATGCGITPFFAMLQDVASPRANGKQVTLLWGIRDERDEFSSRYLAEAAKYMNLSIIPCVSEPIASQPFYHGTVTEKIRELQFDFKTTDFYLCGNPAMIAEMHSWLRNRDASGIYFET